MSVLSVGWENVSYIYVRLQKARTRSFCLFRKKPRTLWEAVKMIINNDKAHTNMHTFSDGEDSHFFR